MSWSTIRGQDQAIASLRADLSAGRVASAYLLAGPDGCGKQLAARELAKALNCAQPADGAACGACAECRRIEHNQHPDLHTLEPSGASETIKVEEVRVLLGRVNLRPLLGRTQVVILDGADRLTDDAANTLLKSLEEPPARTRFMLLTSQLSRCLPTIVSRCRLVRFARLAPDVIASLLAAQDHGDSPAVRLASRLAHGSVSQAEALLEDERAWSAMIEQLETMDRDAWLRWRPPTDRDELRQWLDAGIRWLRDVAVVSVAGTAPAHHQDHTRALAAQAARLDGDRCVQAALRMIEWRQSLVDQSISARLIGTLFKEEWLSLFP